MSVQTPVSSAGPESQEAAEQAARVLLNRPTPTNAPLPYNNLDKPLSKPKWHFGIRSRSPPMEVMLEIYKTLNTLGMQWKRKDGITMPEIGLPPDGRYPEEVDLAIEQWTAEHGGVAPVFGVRNPGKKEISAHEKAAQNLYLVETRAQYGEVVVSAKLNLQEGIR